MEPIGCPATSATNYKFTLCNIQDERRSHLHRNGSLQSQIATQLCKKYPTYSVTEWFVSDYKRTQRGPLMAEWLRRQRSPFRLPNYNFVVISNLSHALISTRVSERQRFQPARNIKIIHPFPTWRRKCSGFDTLLNETGNQKANILNNSQAYCTIPSAEFFWCRVYDACYVPCLSFSFLWLP